ncbi:hypothetical protein EPI10_016203 [Gossypium australe]|uniref:Uncharacterized protein n=1 Tax=Gossypium australe TaxID=47621 RepID=A0A5B6VN80_9ROSI|nr:hypothetical protein EPI10_016203 [Gossypium australe]
MFARLFVSEDGCLLAKLQFFRSRFVSVSLLIRVWIVGFVRLSREFKEILISTMMMFCVFEDEDLRRLILTEAHSSSYAMHPGPLGSVLVAWVEEGSCRLYCEMFGLSTSESRASASIWFALAYSYS